MEEIQKKLSAKDRTFLKKITADVIEASRVSPGQEIAHTAPI